MYKMIENRKECILWTRPWKKLVIILFKTISISKRNSFDFFFFFPFEEVGRCQIVLIFLTGIAVMGSVLENINVSYILPYAKCDLKLTTAEQGILSSISFLGIVFTSHFWGFLADTWGRQKVMRTAALGGSIFAMMSGFAANTTTLILFRFISGAL